MTDTSKQESGCRETVLLNHSRTALGCESGGAVFGLSAGELSCGSLGLSAGAGLSFCGGGENFPVSSAHTKRLVEHLLSRGGVALAGGRRYAVAAAMATVIGMATTPPANALDITNGQISTGVSVSTGLNNPMNISSGGVASDTTISEGGRQNVSGGGVAISTTISEGGIQNVFGGGVANATAINAGGGQYVLSGGTANNTTVSGGSMIVYTGGIASGAMVMNGGWLGGGGTLVGNLSVAVGGRIAPGGLGSMVTSGTTLTVSGNLNVLSGGAYAVHADHEGTDTDRVTVIGSASFANGAIVQHIAGANLGTSVADPSKQWTILTATGGITNDGIKGKSNLLFLAPVFSVDSGGTDLLMSFKRAFAFTDFGSTPNQIAVAGGLSSLDPMGPLATAIIAGFTGTDPRGLYDQLSGEMHASLTSGLMRLDSDFSRGIMARSGRASLARIMLSSAVPSFGSREAFASLNPRRNAGDFINNFWADAGYARQGGDGDGNAGRYTLKGPEVSLGYDHSTASGWLGGVAFRYADRDMNLNSRQSEADIDSYSLALHGGFQTAFGPGAARLVLGGAFTRHDIDGKRSVDIGGNRQRLEADYHANSYQLFMEGAYAIPVGRIWVEPFLNLSWLSTHVSGFTEKGGSAALRSYSQSQNNLAQLLGVRLVLPAFGRINLEAQAGWRHSYGKQDKTSAFSFAEGGGRFGIRGNKANRDEAVLDLRASYKIRDNLRVGLDAAAAIGPRGNSLRGGAFVALEW